MERPRHNVRPTITRSRFVLELASELVGDTAWPYLQARVILREKGKDPWKEVCFFGSDACDAIPEVAAGNVQVAILNPSQLLTLALRGKGPFEKPLPLRMITVIPSLDQLAFAVSGKTGLASLADIRERRFPLRLSLRGEPHHSIHIVVKEVLSQFGFSLDDIAAWGGQVRYDPAMPDRPSRIGAVGRGEIDAIFDEALDSWGDTALDLGMRFLPLEEPVLQCLEAMGFRRAAIPKSQHPKLESDVPALDFSGFAVYTYVDADDKVIEGVCAALEARKDRIPWQGEGPLPLKRMCSDTPEAPRGVPLHPAAERFWRARGYL
jgi:TRAP-type uncharacterized transport system substrate-binding protein